MVFFVLNSWGNRFFVLRYRTKRNIREKIDGSYYRHYWRYCFDFSDQYTIGHDRADVRPSGSVVSGKRKIPFLAAGVYDIYARRIYAPSF